MGDSAREEESCSGSQTGGKLSEKDEPPTAPVRTPAGMSGQLNIVEEDKGSRQGCIGAHKFNTSRAGKLGTLSENTKVSSRKRK